MMAESDAGQTEETPEGDWPVHDHVQGVRRFFDRFNFPEAPLPLRDWLTTQVDTLLESHEQGDSAAAFVIWLSYMPAQRPAPDKILSTELRREEAERIVADTYRFDSWDAVAAVGDRPLDPRFEQAVEAIIHGCGEELQRLLEAQPSLVQARSAYGHGAALLHYVSANGVENHRQITPGNAAQIARQLLSAGADPDGLCGSYGGGPNSTPLCLTVSSCHPFAAGVQGDIVEALLAGGARVNGLNDDSMPLATALAFGYLQTAELLAQHGAHADNVVLAAGLGRVDRLRSTFNEAGHLATSQTYVDPFGDSVTDPEELINRAYFLACKLGHADAARFLLEHGAHVDFAPQREETALHWAAYHGHLNVVRLLVEHGADLSLTDEQWHARPADWATEGRHAAIAEFLTRKAG